MGVLVTQELKLVAPEDREVVVQALVQVQLEEVLEHQVKETMVVEVLGHLFMLEVAAVEREVLDQIIQVLMEDQEEMDQAYL